MTEKLENIALISSAGAGKTRALTQRFLTLYMGDCEKLKQLYGITFTNEAAFEMKTRILRYLTLLASSQPQDESEQAVLDYFNARFPDVQKRAGALRGYLLDNLSDLNISTFHSLFSAFLSSIPFAAGIMPGYEIIDEVYEGLLYEEMLDRYLESVVGTEATLRTIDELVVQRDVGVKKAIGDVYGHVLPWLNYLGSLVNKEEEIRRAVTNTQEEFTNSLRRFVQFIARNESAGYIKSGKRLNNDIVKLLAYIEEYLVAQTFDKLLDSAYTQAILSREIAEKRYIKNFAANCGAQADEFDSLMKELTTLAAKCLLVLSNQQILIHLKPILDIHGMLQEEKRKHNLLSFDDIEHCTLRALKYTSEPDYLYFKIGSVIAHLMIDEFQDTSHQQLEIIEPLISEIISAEPQEKSLFYVGDPKQAIYRWRGGSPALFNVLLNKYPGKIQYRELVTNYRSKKEIIEFVNTVLDKKDCEKQGNVGGWVRVTQCGTFNDHNEGTECLIATTANTIEQLHSDFGYFYSDMAVLVRTNSFGASVADVLSARGIPCVSRSRADIMSNDDVRFVLNLLQFLDNPENDYALMHVLVSSPFGIKEETLRQLNRSQTTLYSNIMRSHPGWPAMKRLSALLKRVHISTPYELVYGICEELEMNMSYGLATLLDIAHEYTADKYGHLSAFLDWIEKVGPSFEVKEVHPEGVKVLTIHRAKGLEFDIVFLPETNWKLKTSENPQLLFSYEEQGARPAKIYWRKYGKYLDHLKQAEQERIENDELNLLYVGLTRAKHGLYVLGFKYKRNQVGFWLDRIMNKYGSAELAVGEVVKRGVASPEVDGSTRYGPLKKGPMAVKDERIIYSPTERGIELLDSARRRRMEYGSIIHQALSTVQWLDDVVVQQVLERAAKVTAAAFARTSEEARDIELYIQKLMSATFADPALRFAFFQDGRDIECKNEVSIYFEEEKKDVSGIIDRLLIEPDVLTVLDYKTGEAKHEYAHQLKTYCRGLEKIYPSKRIRALLIYLDKTAGDRCVEVS